MRRFMGRVVAAISMVGMVTASGCGTRQELPTGDQATGIIGPAGGSLELEGGAVSLQVPAGALTADTHISLTLTEEGAPTGATAMVIEVAPASLKALKPLLLKVKHVPGEVPAGDPAWLRLVRVDAKGAMQATGPALGGQAAFIGGMIPGGGKYKLANLKTAGALKTTTKARITDVDLLFVVDNSGSMAHEQKNLSKNFPVLMKKLAAEMKSYRVGVVSTDMGAGTRYTDQSCVQGGDGGKLQNKPRSAGCVGPKDAWIEATPTGSNVPGGDVSAAFSCIAQLGTDGCGFEQPLESAYKALDPQLNINPGFLRKDAALALVYLSDEDDCSASSDLLFDTSRVGLNDPLGPLTSFRCFEFGVTCDINDRFKKGLRKGCVPAKKSAYMHPVERYLKQLKQLKPAGQVVVSAIAGPDSPVEVTAQGTYPALASSCKSTDGQAFPAVRLSHLVKAFGKRGAVRSICDSDFSPALDVVANLVTTQTQLSWCLPYDPTDTDPSTTEVVEGDCLVVGSKAGKIPVCSQTNSGPCHRLVKSQTCGSSTTVMELENITPAALGASVHANCLVL